MRLTRLIKNAIDNLNPLETQMNPTRTLALLVILASAPVSDGCGMPVTYDPCYSGASCYSGANDGDGQPDGNGGTSTYDCSNFVELATAACNGDLLYSECDPETGRNVVLCDTDGDGQSDVNVTIVVEDGDVSVQDNDSADYGDGDADTDTDADGDSDADGDADTDTDDDCVESAGGVEYCDGVDNDCDGSIDNGDFDDDGYISDDCTAYSGDDPESRSTGDCQDSGTYVGWIHSSLIHPGQIELGDWIDQDCDGQDDEDDGCTVQCDTDSDLTDEEFEQDGDSAFECVSAFFVADQSSDSNPLDQSLTWSYDNGSSTTSYSGISVTCEETAAIESDPTQWEDIDDIESELCARTPALATADCIALF